MAVSDPNAPIFLPQWKCKKLWCYNKIDPHRVEILCLHLKSSPTALCSAQFSATVLYPMQWQILMADFILLITEKCESNVKHQQQENITAQLKRNLNHFWCFLIKPPKTEYKSKIYIKNNLSESHYTAEYRRATRSTTLITHHYIQLVSDVLFIAPPTHPLINSLIH